MRVLPLAAAVAAVIPVAVASGATGTTYVTRSFNEPSAQGLAVTGPLSDYRASSRARVVVPTAWRVTGTRAGTLRLRTAQNPSCTYDLTYSVRSVLDAPGDAAARAKAALPAGARYVLDEGQHGNRAWRVIRTATKDGRVHMSALWNGVLTKRSDIAPSGKAAWTEIRVDAVSRPGSECHSGTYRVSVGPAIGDSLAVARTTLHFGKA